MLLFWMDRADSLSGIAKHLERRVSDYITTKQPVLRPARQASGAGYEPTVSDSLPVAPSL